jgi:hypothetical protein
LRYPARSWGQCSATIWVKAGGNLDECPDRADGGMIAAEEAFCNG